MYFDKVKNAKEEEVAVSELSALLAIVDSETRRMAEVIASVLAVSTVEFRTAATLLEEGRSYGMWAQHDWISDRIASAMGVPLGGLSCV